MYWNQKYWHLILVDHKQVVHRAPKCKEKANYSNWPHRVSSLDQRFNTIFVKSLNRTFSSFRQIIIMSLNMMGFLRWTRETSHTSQTVIKIHKTILCPAPMLEKMFSTSCCIVIWRLVPSIQGWSSWFCRDVEL